MFFVFLVFYRCFTYRHRFGYRNSLETDIETFLLFSRWDRDRAISFLSNYSDFPASQIEAEVDRYITWPGQACAYKVGEIKIKEMRQRAEEQLGNHPLQACT